VDHALGDPHALRAVVGSALFLTVLGALGVGPGALARNTAGGIAALVGLLFVLPGITALLPASLGHAIGARTCR
jgi:ABC-2 type transport system permease protein